MTKQQHIDYLKNEKHLWGNGYNYIAGVDEVGRGCLAGPVVAAAVILPKDIDFEEIIDSKQLSAVKREIAFKIIQNVAISISIYAIPAKTIDRINILQASMAAMLGAISKLKTQPGYVLIDGNHAPTMLNIPYECIIKGDQLSRSIAAASIIAKVTRDRLMKNLDKFYSDFKFETNKGYGTSAHLNALNELGPTPHHRFSFSPVRQMTLKFK